MKGRATHKIEFRHKGEVVKALAYQENAHVPFYWITKGPHQGCGVHINKILNKKRL